MKNLNKFDISKSVVNINVYENHNIKQEKINAYIYIVEDDVLVAEYHAAIISDYFNIDTKIFTDVCTALSNIIVNPSNCAGIISDVFLYSDKCNIRCGVDMVEKLLESNINIPVLFCTGLSGASDMNNLNKFGYVCNKPLLDHVTRYIDNTNINTPLSKFITDIRNNIKE